MGKFCTSMLATGACTNASCTKRHDIYICTDCGISTTEGAKDAHLRSKKHRKRVQGFFKLVRCPLCEVVMAGVSCWRSHLNGRKHAAVAESKGVSASVDPEELGGDVAGHRFCSTCDTYVQDRYWSTHSLNKVHQRKTRFSAMRSAMAEAAKDKHGVTVSGGDSLDFGVLDSSLGQRRKDISLEIRATVPSSSITLLEAKLTPKRVQRTTPFTVHTDACNKKLVCGRPVAVVLSFTHEHLGIYEDRVELVFEDTHLQQKFMIARQMRAIVGAPGYSDLQPKAPFVPKKRASRDHDLDVVPGDPPPALGAIRYIVPLPEARIPHYCRQILSTGSSASSIARQFRETMMAQRFEDMTYGRHFKALLWAEEYRSEADLQVYDIDSATLNKHNYHYLDVPGLAEKRPSVLVGDGILVQAIAPGIDEKKWYEGRVHVVRQAEVGMKFSPSFPQYPPSQRYRVRFTLNRYPLRRQHQALDGAFSPARLLFPTADHIKASAPIANLVVHNPLIANNPPQLRAIRAILGMPPGSPPFAVFGPPGTGKTVTIVEAIRQLLDRSPTARILACAPSNSAADIIAERLSVALNEDQLFRFYAPSRSRNQVPLALRDYSCMTPSGHFTAPPVPTLKRYRVIVSTCVSASFAHGVGMPQGHFTHVFVDEAGQATEPEVMIGIKTMGNNDTNVILSGDPKQLGPIIRSAVARELGLEKSYLERMMERDAYKPAQWQGVTVVQLTQNFRSHPSILKFPNEQFYGNTLQPHGDPAVINSYIGSPILVNRKFPVIFHALAGQDARESSSPSFFNVLQALQVKKYVEQLRSDRMVRISDRDIAVVTPYHAQVLKIRAALGGVADEVRVGSVEELQGQERRVIIISTVRSSREFVDYDLKHTLGFLANPRRLNVAITRAQALLIVIGDPTVLSLDPLWRKFLNYIHNHGGWRGDEPTWDTHDAVDENGNYDAQIRDAAAEDMNDLMRRMESFTLQGLNGVEAKDESGDEENVDRPWREVE